MMHRLLFFGQKPLELKTAGNDTYFSVIVSGTDVLKGSDIQGVDDSNYTWKHLISRTIDNEAIYVYFNFDEPYIEHSRYLEMMINCWLSHPEYGMDFWDLELKGGRTQEYYPVYGAYIHSDDVYDEITSVISEFYPHDEGMQ
ncbi:MAG: hypothetical protein ACLR0U_28360 [Enterocloster clostridioformis]